MILWTIQTVEWYNQFLQKGIIFGTGKYITQDWEFCLLGYEWLMNKMDKKIGKRPFKECFPVWAWYQYKDINKPKPDLRSSGFLPKGTKGVRVEINKKENEVLLSDFVLWHFPFAYHHFIGENEQEAIEFEELLKSKGLDQTAITELPKKIQAKIIKSWDKVLDLDFHDPYYTEPRERKMIQATFWTVSLDEVVRVDKFIAR